MSTQRASLSMQRMQRKIVLERYAPPLQALAAQCAQHWDSPENPDFAKLAQLLQTQFSRIPNLSVLYLIDKNKRQISPGISPSGADASRLGQDLSASPYADSLYPKRHFALSPVYINGLTRRPCITALQPVCDGPQFLGFIAADFDLHDLPMPARPLASCTDEWRQVSGDPAIRANLFQQQRVTSPMDRQMEDMLAILQDLMCARGVFYCTLHFGSSQAMLWHVDDPYRYRLLVLQEILDPAVCLTYPPRPYPQDAVIKPQQVRQILERLALLRGIDETLYLRSCSLNLMNGMVGLTFSCDGSHYLSVDNFLSKDMGFWLGSVNHQQPLPSAVCGFTFPSAVGRTPLAALPSPGD